MQDTHTFAAFLFDMDGTLTNSIAAAERVWTRWAMSKGLDVEALLSTIHGVRCVDTMRRLNLPGVDPEREAERLAQMETDDVEGVVSIDGAARFLAALPPERWAVVTSAPRRLAERRILAAGLPLPNVMVAAEDVERGKPAPDCFQLAAKKLGVKPEDCLVFEDAPAGIAAAEAAGAKVMVITATHKHPVETPHPGLGSYDTYTVSLTDQGWLSLRPR
jgi:sugar-phosphatase